MILHVVQLWELFMSLTNYHDEILNIFITQAVCVQQIIPRKLGKLNHVSFNPTHPLIIVGDNLGQVRDIWFYQ